jgi:2-polyprenyl-3-methyl-5-hydroxy-6-metoxy-1,4-benzoquinol methylase
MKEEQIRPKKVFDEYLRLAETDAGIYFASSDKNPIFCPACGSLGSFVFTKHSLAYEECPKCQTIFVSPRPPASDFFAYYKNSESARYFATTFYKETATVRREKLWRRKVSKVHSLIIQHGKESHAVLDIGGGYGIFAEEYKALSGSPVTVIEPGPELAETCRNKGLSVIESFLENVTNDQLPDKSKVFVSFELFEHLHDCPSFLRHLHGLMKPGDMFIFTTLSGMGVDIQALWNNSNSFSLQHLNFFNPKSIRILLDNAGFRALQIDTPGKLDMDILANNRLAIKDRFWRNMISQSTVAELQEWQVFISSHGVSSHMLVVCERI